MKKTSDKLPTHKLRATHYLIASINKVLLNKPFEQVASVDLTMQNEIDKEKIMSQWTHLLNEIHTQTLSYRQRKLIIDLCTPAELVLQRPELSTSVCNYKVASIESNNCQQPIQGIECMILYQLYRLYYVGRILDYKGIIFAWYLLKQHIKNKRKILSGIIRLKQFMILKSFNLKSWALCGFIKNLQYTRNIILLNQRIVIATKKSIDNCFSILRLPSNSTNLATNTRNNTPSFKRFDTFSEIPEKINTCDYYLENKVAFRKALRRLELTLSDNLKLWSFNKLKRKQTEISYLKNNRKKYYHAQSINIINKYSLAETINKASNIHKFTLNLLMTLIKNRMSRYFYIINAHAFGKKEITFSTSPGSIKFKRMPVPYKTKILFLICHRIVNNNIICAFSKLLKIQKRLSKRSMVVYGRIKGIKRSCTPNRYGPFKRISIETDDPSFCMFTRRTK